MSKAAEIMALHAQGKTVREIASTVFCTDTPTDANLAYVRVARLRAAGSGYSKADRNYFLRFGGNTIREGWQRCYSNDSAWRARIARNCRLHKERRKQALAGDTNQI